MTQKIALRIIGLGGDGVKMMNRIVQLMLTMTMLLLLLLLVVVLLLHGIDGW